MSAEENKALMRHWYEVLDKGKAVFMAEIDEFCAPNYIIHNGFGADIHGLDNVKQFLGGFADAFPDLHFTTEDIIAEGDRIVARFTWTGTNSGAFMGVPATNKGDFLDDRDRSHRQRQDR